MSSKYDKNFSALSENIIYYRKLYGYTQQELADMINIERSNLAKMESGDNRGTIENLIALSDAFNVSADSLLNYDVSEIRLNMNRKIQHDFVSFCTETGISVESAFLIYMKKVLRDKKFPFEISLND